MTTPLQPLIEARLLTLIIDELRIMILEDPAPSFEMNTRTWYKGFLIEKVEGTFYISLNGRYVGRADGLVTAMRVIEKL